MCVDATARARRLGVNPDVYRRAGRSFYILLGKASQAGDSTDEVDILKKMPNDEVVAYVRYHELDKKYPSIFNRNGFVMS